MSEIWYKVLGDGGVPHLGTGAWHLPRGTRPGMWMPKIAELELCRAGYHVCTADQLVDLLSYGLHIYEVEVRGGHLEDNAKSCWQEARLVRELQWGARNARLFACDCAAAALAALSGRCREDGRSRAAVEVARRYALGEASCADLAAAGAAREAAENWQTKRLLQYLYGEVLP